MRKFFVIICLVFIFLLVGCGSKQVEKPIIVLPTINECPEPEKPVLKLLPSGHIGSKQVVSTLIENYNILELYSGQLENVVDCYKSQVEIINSKNSKNP